jgi:hypothetical protein
MLGGGVSVSAAWVIFWNAGSRWWQALVWWILATARRLQGCIFGNSQRWTLLVPEDSLQTAARLARRMPGYRWVRRRAVPRIRQSATARALAHRMFSEPTQRVRTERVRTERVGAAGRRGTRQVVGGCGR